MKKLDKVLIGARNQDLEVKIREANYLEELAVNGKSPESVITEVKETLGIEETGSVIAEYETKASELNKLQKNLVDVNGLTQRLLNDKLISDDDLAVLESIEHRLAVKVAGVYGLELSELYLEEGNE